jgi:MGT family glycosyltransferase
MSHILVCNVPFHGHVNPTLAVVRELVARGETVHYYLTDTFRPAIEAAGAVFKSYESRLVGGAKRGPRRRPPPSTILEGMLEECCQVYDQVIDAVQAEPPDYIIYDSMCLWGPLLARQLDIPAVAFHTSFVSTNTSVSVIPSTQHGAADPSYKNVRLFIQQLQEEYQHPMPGLHHLWGNVEPLNLVFFPHILQPDIDDEGFIFVGPSIRPHEDAGIFPLERLGAESVLYISLGTVLTGNVDFYRMCFNAFADKPWQVVMSYGTRFAPIALGPTPANFLIAAHVPQLAVLQRAAVFLTHGGMGSVTEALYYGVPMVLCPQTREQIITARRLVDLGLGVMLIAAVVTKDTLEDAVEQVMSDPAFRARAQTIQQVVRAEGGYQQVVDTLCSWKDVYNGFTQDLSRDPNTKPSLSST